MSSVAVFEGLPMRVAFAMNTSARVARSFLCWGLAALSCQETIMSVRAITAYAGRAAATCFLALGIILGMY
jgi:hypothetical protein